MNGGKTRRVRHSGVVGEPVVYSREGGKRATCLHEGDEANGLVKKEFQATDTAASAEDGTSEGHRSLFSKDSNDEQFSKDSNDERLHAEKPPHW